MIYLFTASKKSSNSTTQMGNTNSYTKKKSSTPIAASGYSSRSTEEAVVEKSLTPKPVVTKESPSASAAANKRPSQRPLPTKSSSGSLRTSALKNNEGHKTTSEGSAQGPSAHGPAQISRDDSPSSTKVNVSSSSSDSSVSPPPLPNPMESLELPRVT